MSTFDPSAFDLQTKGNKFEEFTVGRRFVHHWGRTVTAGDNALFTTTMCNWSPMYVNAEYARLHGHPDTVVNPMFVLCTVVGLSVEDLSESGGPFLGLEDCEFHLAVHPGDTLTAASTVVEARASSSRPDAGVVTWRTEGRNQLDELVVSFRRSNLVARVGTVNVGLATPTPLTHIDSRGDLSS